MTTARFLQITDWFGGIARDEKTKARGVALNMEEIDIFSNANYFQAEQIFSSDAMPASTEIYAYTVDKDDQVWGYGANTGGSNEVRLVKLTSAGGDNPGAFATVFTSADTTDISYTASPIAYLRQDNGNKDFLYYLTNASGTVKLKSYDIVAGTESENDSGATAMTLTGLDGAFDRLALRVIFGELYIPNGRYIAKIDKDGVFTEQAFTLPNGWEAVDIVAVSDIAIILARDLNKEANTSKGFWWDLTESLQFDDSFNIPWGGPQWIVNHREEVKMLCVQNGKAKFYQLSGAFPGSQPLEIPNMELSNCTDDTTSQTASPPKMMWEKDGHLYFGLNKSDKPGLYVLGRLDSDKPQALLLSKRMGTSDYANHTVIGGMIYGPNFFAAYDDNGTHSHARCESNNSPTRSSNAIYESIIIDDGDPLLDKTLPSIYVNTQPLAASTDVDVYVDPDYSGTFTQYFRADTTSLATTSAVQGEFKVSLGNIKAFQVKLQLTSSTTNSPKVTALGMKIEKQKLPANN